MKSLSSIFSFDTIGFRVSKLFSLNIIYVIVGFLLIEVFIRYIIPDGQYPTGHWRNNELRIQTSQLEELGDVDIMFTGSSLCASNIPPDEFDNEMKKNGIDIISFNTGVRGCDYEGIAEGFKKLFWERKRSKYVVLVISPVDLNDANLGVRNRTSSFIKTFQTPFYKAIMVDFFSQISWVFGFRNEIKEYIKTRKWIYEEPIVGIRGYVPMDLKPNIKVTDLNLKIDKDAVTSQSLFNFVTWLVNQDVKVIIIEALMFSLERERLDPHELKKFYEILEELDKIESINYLNTNDIIPDDKYFIDSGHLSLEGGEVYAKNLANKFLEAGFPW